MKTFKAGDRVWFKSLSGERVYHGEVIGFLGKDHDVALCTDQTGRGSRPVSVQRLKHFLDDL
jgi:hypothetical protein